MSNNTWELVDLPPDIVFTTSKLSRFTSNRAMTIGRVHGYLKKTKNLSIIH